MVLQRSAPGGVESSRVTAVHARRALKREVEHQEHQQGAVTTPAPTGVLHSIGSRFSSVARTLRRVAYRGVVQEVRAYRHLQDVSKKSEFAREMMMLPLSLKNPDVQATSGLKKRGAGKRVGGSNTSGAGGGDGGDKGGFVQGVFEGFLQRRMRVGPER